MGVQSKRWWLGEMKNVVRDIEEALDGAFALILCMIKQRDGCSDQKRRIGEKRRTPPKHRDFASKDKNNQSTPTENHDRMAETEQ